MKACNRYRAWAIRALGNLRLALGATCAYCGATDDLQFDCIIPQGDKHHRWETNRRACFYRRQFAANNLQLLCADCHGIKSATEQGWVTKQMCLTVSSTTHH